MSKMPAGWEELRRERQRRNREKASEQLRREAARRVPAPDPRPGYWHIRKAKGGPRVAACVRWVETTSEPDNPDNDMAGTRSAHLAAFILDEPVAMDRVWHWRLDEITETEYRYICACAAWSREFSPDEPLAQPNKPVDLRHTPIPFLEDK